MEHRQPRRFVCGEVGGDLRPKASASSAADQRPIIASRSALNSEPSLQFGKVDSFAIR